jgi:hypothetical protein
LRVDDTGEYVYVRREEAVDGVVPDLESTCVRWGSGDVHKSTHTLRNCPPVFLDRIRDLFRTWTRRILHVDHGVAQNLDWELVRCLNVLGRRVHYILRSITTSRMQVEWCQCVDHLTELVYDPCLDESLPLSAIVTIRLCLSSSSFRYCRKCRIDIHCCITIASPTVDRSSNCTDSSRRVGDNDLFPFLELVCPLTFPHDARCIDSTCSGVCVTKYDIAAQELIVKGP